MKKEIDSSKLEKVITKPGDYPISSIFEKYKDGDIIHQPPFQRDYVMDDKKASKLIESIIMEVPIPTVYLCEENDGKLSVIDGQQRIRSIVRYKDNDFSLKTLEVLTDLNGKKYKDLPKELQRKINETTIHVIKLSKESKELKYEIFARLNQGSTKLVPQELRNCIYRGSFNDMLESIAKSNKKLEILFVSPNNRKSYQETVLRFFAMQDYNNYKGSILKTLNTYMSKHQNDDEDAIKEHKNKFNSTMNTIYTVLGEEAFCTTDRESGELITKFSGSVYDSIAIPFSLFNPHDLIAKADEIRKAINSMKLNDERYKDITYGGTGSTSKVRGRIIMVYNLLQEITGKNGDVGVTRAYSKKIRQKMFYKGIKCAICGNEILSVEDSEVDHIKPYSVGGETEMENAQLVHRHCNRVKSNKME